MNNMTLKEIDFISREVCNQECPYCGSKPHFAISAEGEYPQAVFFIQGEVCCEDYYKYVFSRIGELHKTFLMHDAISFLNS